MDCCYECANYVDCLCIITNDYDGEDPSTFSCEDFTSERDDDE